MALAAAVAIVDQWLAHPNVRVIGPGMDYWQHVDWQRWRNWGEFAASVPTGARVWFVESGGPQRYDEARFEAGDYLVFGRETAGLPAAR